MLSQLRLLRDRLLNTQELEKDVFDEFPFEELRYLCDICALLMDLGVCDVLHSAPEEDDE